MDTYDHAEADSWQPEPLAEWAVSLCEPLLPPWLALSVDKHAAHTFAKYPEISSQWLTSWIGDVLSTLPTTDPWRQLSGRVKVDDGPVMVRPGLFAMPKETGAAGPNGRFGTWRDGTDLVPVAHSNLLVDVGLAALAEALSDESAALLAMLSSDISTGQQAMAVLGDGYDFSVAAPAARWVLWRRRCYTGPQDSYPLTSALGWLTKTSRAARGRKTNMEELEQERRDEELPNELYDPVVTDTFWPQGQSPSIDMCSPPDTEALVDTSRPVQRIRLVEPMDEGGEGR